MNERGERGQDTAGIADWRAAERLVHALQFEGYVLYPYRRSALKNQQRWAFGTLYPPAVASELAERSSASSEFLLCAAQPELLVSIRVLQVVTPLADDGVRERPTWHRLVERCLDVEVDGGLQSAGGMYPPGAAGAVSSFVVERAFSFDAVTATCRSEDPAESEELCGALIVRLHPLWEGVSRVHVELQNRSSSLIPDRDVAYRASLVAAHTIVECRHGHFVSPYDPQPALAEATEGCVQDGLYPALIGSADEARVLITSPIIVGDQPKIADESPGEFYDMAEIDEMLALRVETLTPEEKAEVRATDPRARHLLERTEALNEKQRLRLHGRTILAEPNVMEPALPVDRGVTHTASGKRHRLGDRVRINPRAGGDVLDLALTGEAATVCAVEEDFEGRFHFAVTVDADPGNDLGRQGLPGHRFFFTADELEPIS